MTHCDRCAQLEVGHVYREKRDLAYLDEATIAMVKVPGHENQRRVRIAAISGDRITICTLTDIHGNPVPPKDTKISRSTLDRHYTFIAH